MIDEIAIRLRFEALRPSLDERGRRLFAAVEARAAGVGGVAAVSRATGVARSTIQRGLHELDAPPMTGRVRRAGGVTGGEDPRIDGAVVSCAATTAAAFTARQRLA